MTVRAATNRNTLLAAASVGTLDRWQSDLVRLPAGHVIGAAGEPTRHAYFPTAGLISWLGLTADGRSVELATVSRAGMIGARAAFGLPAARSAAVVQIAGAAVRVGVQDLQRELRTNRHFHEALVRYTDDALAALEQRVLCHRFHPALDRLCRWLLATTDELGGDTVLMTQDALAQLLGMPRTTVARAAATLEDATAITTRYGCIRIADRRRLERSACACYAAIRDRRSARSNAPHVLIG